MQRPGNLNGINGPSWLGELSGRGRGMGRGRGRGMGHRHSDAAHKGRHRGWGKGKRRAGRCGWWCRQKLKWFGMQNPIVIDQAPSGSQNPVVEEIQDTTGIDPTQLNGFFGGWGYF